MTTLTRRFEEAIAKAAALPPQEQDALAALLLAEIEDEQRWEELLSDSRTPGLVQRLAAEAVAEDEAGLTEPLEALLMEGGEDTDRPLDAAR
jgi:hypothetical protein